ncbi:endoplasmic reticulum metallopeptidase 1-like isoform X2 [Helicoverpa zea]|uniref:endoplasmic reticulum metallopeptidase 1-like isoform X1 n=1 Tax=Helicoverpa zea TaxID=7113 RepID=UPI001F5A4F21|nr:endoplasmic reticulum metallopeptidase 1-like isoform X1 [Helicoverpa zea]XP_047036816.1 endoplasmic reticulum metallopeptidase 1-like isoform X2 [Helicoverpa zea]
MSDPDNKNDSRNRGLAAMHIHEYQGVPTAEFEDEIAEKPHERVFDGLRKNSSSINDPIRSVPSTLIILVLGIYLLLGFLTQLVEDGMPSVVPEANVARDNSDTFSEEVAWRYLDRIIGKEPRVSGTPYHLNQTIDLKAMIDEIAQQGNQHVRTDWQIASGDYWHNSSASFFNVYQNTSNIVALLEGESGFHNNGTIGSSILVNCHYDSVPFALGASDNAAFCAIMAETLTKLSRSKQKLKRNVIFLFNGAEENGLQGSHAFLQHPWARGAVAVINLDAAGMNGKPTIFQVTDPRVLKAYHNSAPVPNAQSLAELLFSSGMIPSDTDFRIWRDFGGIYGVDIAFVKWAAVYHTRNDRAELLQPGVMQGAGDMLLAFIAATADIDDLDDKIEPEAAVYYDYLNVFLVSYALYASYVIDVFVALCGLGSVAYYVWLVGPRWSTVQKLLVTALGRLAAMLCGIIAVTICTLIMVATTVQMRYLTQPWLVVPLFWMPYLIVAVGAAQAFDAWTLKRNGLSRSLRCVQAMAATRLLLSCTLLVLCCIPPLTSLRYLFSAPLFVLSGTAVLSLTAVRYVALRGWQHLILEICLSLPSVMLMFSLALRLDAQMLPTMARSGSDKPDYTVAMLNVALAIIVSTTISGLELLFSRKRLWMVLSFVGAICVVLMFIPFNPYDEDSTSLQRHYWFHSEIVSFDYNNATTSRASGVVVTKHDPYSTQHVLPALAAQGYHVNAWEDFTADCEDQVYCGLPLFRTSFGRFLKHALFLNTGPPAAFSPPVSLNVTERVCQSNVCTYKFQFTGANHNLFTFWPRDNVTVSSWSLNSAPQVSFYQRGRPVYALTHSLATYSGAASVFHMEVRFNVPQSLQSQPIVDVSHHSHKIYHPEEFTAEYKNILQAMPRYFNIATFLSFRHNYVF